MKWTNKACSKKLAEEKNLPNYEEICRDERCMVISPLAPKNPKFRVTYVMTASDQR